MTVAVGFWTDFSEQEWGGILVVALVAAGVYGGIMVTAALATRSGTGNLRAICWGSLMAVVWVVALVFLEAIAQYHRPEPVESELDLGLRAEGFEEWQLVAQIAFISLYVVAVLVTAGIAFVLNRRPGLIRATAVLLGFMLITWPFVAYMNECEVGFGSWLGDEVCV